jgi:G3E family GTPase
MEIVCLDPDTYVSVQDHEMRQRILTMLFRIVRTHGPVSKQDLADRLGIKYQQLSYQMSDHLSSFWSVAKEEKVRGARMEYIVPSNPDAVYIAIGKDRKIYIIDPLAELFGPLSDVGLRCDSCSEEDSRECMISLTEKKIVPSEMSNAEEETLRTNNRRGTRPLDAGIIESLKGLAAGNRCVLTIPCDRCIFMKRKENSRPNAGKTRFLVLGGYLGAGKTTLAVNLARTLKEKNDRSVAIITNDQGDVLVDTEFTKDAGFDVREILGGCFCSNFDEFVSSARTLVSAGRPDIIIAEPIGTSTNLMGSVVAPLRSLYPDEFDVAPFTVVIDCIRATDILSGSKEKSIESVDLIPAHQIKEAEVVILSKADMVRPDAMAGIKEELRKILPDADIIETSSSDLRNIDRITEMILSGRTSTKAAERDNNRGFAFEKAKLGWYSGTFTITPSNRVDMYSMSSDIMRGVAKEYGPKAIVHVKVIISSPDASAKMSLVQESIQVDGIHGSRFISGVGKLVLNARVISPPKRLEDTMRKIIDSLSTYPAKIEKVSESCFSPKPESPSHFFFE